MSQGEHPTDPDRAANERLGAAIAELRQGAGLTGPELAERAEMREQEIAAIEAGELEPTWGDLRHIAQALGTPLPRLLGMVETPEGAEPDPG
jgi:transcriptional regulator with XRE-family HTH domain